VSCCAAALQALKKRKLYESQLESVENNIMRVNEQQMMLENQRTTVETVSALSNAAKASKQTMHEMKVRLCTSSTRGGDALTSAAGRRGRLLPLVFEDQCPPPQLQRDSV